MTPWLDDGDVSLYHGDALDVLRELPNASVDCCVTSPPYWGLRDYGMDGQIGLEPTPDLFVHNMVAVFREVRRVLADHGTCWVNLGDSYHGGGYANHAVNGEEWLEAHGGDRRRSRQQDRINANPGLKPKDLVGIPWRVAFALQADGWYLRSDIVWAKPNPMPESVTDRPTKAHEYVFLLTKRPRYWFDTEAVREPLLPSSVARGEYGHASFGKGQFNGSPSDERHQNGKQVRKVSDLLNPSGRNARSVWQIATQPYPEAHFATFPEELARRCILAGCPTRVCVTCGKPSERIVERERTLTPVVPTTAKGTARENGEGVYPPNSQETGGVGGLVRSETVGWSDCGHNAWRPGVVIDPFIGSGTVAKVARDHQRHAIGIDLSEPYLKLAARRLQQLSLLNEAQA